MLDFQKVNRPLVFHGFQRLRQPVVGDNVGNTLEGVDDDIVVRLHNEVLCAVTNRIRLMSGQLRECLNPEVYKDA